MLNEERFLNAIECLPDEAQFVEVNEYLYSYFKRQYDYYIAVANTGGIEGVKERLWYREFREPRPTNIPLGYSVYLNYSKANIKYYLREEIRNVIL